MNLAKEIIPLKRRILFEKTRETFKIMLGKSKYTGISIEKREFEWWYSESQMKMLGYEFQKIFEVRCAEKNDMENKAGIERYNYDEFYVVVNKNASTLNQRYKGMDEWLILKKHCIEI